MAFNALSSKATSGKTFRLLGILLFKHKTYLYVNNSLNFAHWNMLFSIIFT